MSEITDALAIASTLIERLNEQGLLEERRWAIHGTRQSPWVLVDADAAELYDVNRVLRLRFAIWVPTGALYAVGPDGSVGDDPISLDAVRA